MAKLEKKVKKSKVVEKEESKKIAKKESFLKRFHAWWIVGFILPPLGLFLYLLWKKNRKNDAKSAGTGALISTIVWLFIGLSFLINTNGEPKEEITISKWLEEYNNGETLVTVIASSTCPHCKNLKPIITASSNKYRSKLYFFEADTLSEDEYKILSTTVELKGYEGYVPYVFTIVDKKLTNSTTGEMSDTELTKFLKEAKVIKD